MKQIAVFFCTLLLATQVYANASIQIYPMEITIFPDKPTDVITLANKGDSDVDIQASAKSWDMDENGKFIEVEIGDFVFFPRLLHIPAHEEKTIKLGYNGQFPDIEKSYRLILEELPPIRSVEEQAKTKKTQLGINWVMRLSVPLFVAASTEIPAPHLIADELKKNKQSWAVAIKNPANRHLKVQQLTAELRDNANKSLEKIAIQVGVLRILPQRRIWLDLPFKTKKCSKDLQLNLEFILEQQSEIYPLNLPINPKLCH